MEIHEQRASKRLERQKQSLLTIYAGIIAVLLAVVAGFMGYREYRAYQATEQLRSTLGIGATPEERKARSDEYKAKADDRDRKFKDQLEKSAARSKAAMDEITERSVERRRRVQE